MTPNERADLFLSVLSIRTQLAATIQQAEREAYEVAIEDAAKCFEDYNIDFDPYWREEISRRIRALQAP